MLRHYNSLHRSENWCEINGHSSFPGFKTLKFHCLQFRLSQTHSCKVRLSRRSIAKGRVTIWFSLQKKSVPLHMQRDFTIQSLNKRFRSKSHFLSLPVTTSHSIAGIYLYSIMPHLWACSLDITAQIVVSEPMVNEISSTWCHLVCYINTSVSHGAWDRP